MPAQGPHNQAAKGNPASHRMGNPQRKVRYARNWLAQQKRKDANRKANAERAYWNKSARKDATENGEIFRTAWQKAELKRAERRKGKRIAWELLHDKAAI